MSPLRRRRSPALAAGCCALFLCAGCLALNAAGEPVGAPERVSAVRICPRCLGKLDGEREHICWLEARPEAGPSARVCPSCGRGAEGVHAHVPGEEPGASEAPKGGD